MAMRWHKAPNKLRDRRFLSLTPSARGVLACLEELLAADPVLVGNVSQIASWVVVDRKVTRESLDAIGASGYLEIALENQGKAGTFYTIRYPSVPQACPDRTPSVPQPSPERHPDKSSINAALAGVSLYRVEEKRIDKNPLTPKGDDGGSQVPSEEVPFSEPLLDEPDPEDLPDDDTPAWKKNPAFVAFWKAYPGPRKKSAAGAFARWTKLGIGAKQVPLLMAALAEDAAGVDWTKDGGRFIPAPDVWLGRKRWLDDPAPSQNLVEFKKPDAPANPHADKPWAPLNDQRNFGYRWADEAEQVKYLAGRLANTLNDWNLQFRIRDTYQAEGFDAAMTAMWGLWPGRTKANG